MTFSGAWPGAPTLLACVGLLGLSHLAGGRGQTAPGPSGTEMLSSPGIKVGTLALTKRVFVRATVKGKPVSVAGVALDGSGRTLVWTAYDARWYDRHGTVERSVPFARELMGARAASLTNGDAPGFVGLKPPPGRAEAVVLGPDGRVTATMKAWLSFDIGDLAGDADPEILLAFTDGVAVHDRTGRRLTFISAPSYLDHARVVPPADGGKARIALHMYRPRERSVRIEVRDAAGAVLNAWNQSPDAGRRLWVFGWANQPPGLWTARDGALVMTSVDGTERERHVVPGADRLRYVHAGEMAGARKVFVASGGGYVCASLLAVVGPDGDLQYLETFRARSHALATHGPGGRRFLVATGSEVWEYASSGAN